MPNQKAIAAQDRREANHAYRVGADKCMTTAMQHMGAAQEQMSAAQAALAAAAASLVGAHRKIDWAIGRYANADWPHGSLVGRDWPSMRLAPEPLDALCLPSHVRNTLFRAGIDTVEEVRAMDADALMAIHNIGPDAQAMVQDALACYESEGRPRIP